MKAKQKAGLCRNSLYMLLLFVLSFSPIASSQANYSFGRVVYKQNLKVQKSNQRMTHVCVLHVKRQNKGVEGKLVNWYWCYDHHTRTAELLGGVSRNPCWWRPHKEDLEWGSRGISQKCKLILWADQRKPTVSTGKKNWSNVDRSQKLFEIKARYLGLTTECNKVGAGGQIHNGG